MEKGERIPDKAAPKSYFPFLSRTTIEPAVRIRGPNWSQEKLATRWVSSLASWIAGKLEQARNFPRNKSKIKRKSTTGILPSYVTQCRWSAKQTIPLSVLVRNQTKGFGLEISTRPEVGREGQWEVGPRNSEKAVSDGPSTLDSRETSRHERESRVSEGRPVKMSQHSSWVVEFSLEIHASDSLNMHKGMQSVT